MRVGMLTYGMGEYLTGIGRYTRELCRALARIDSSVEIVLINPYQIDKQDFFSEFENYYTPSLGKLPAVLGTGTAILPAICRRLGLDVFHDPCGISPFLLPRRKNETRRVVTIHDAVPYVYPHVQPFLTKFTFRTFIPLARRNVDAIVTVSESSRKDLIRYVGFLPHQVHVTYHGVSVQPESVRLRRNLVHKPLEKWGLFCPYFLYVGALNPRKNVPTLIAAFEGVLQSRPDVKLVLVGPSTWWAEETLQAAKRFEESVIVTGYVEDEELAALYANASALVYPSIYEGFGLPPLEAMAYGTPVITSNVSSLPEVVGDAGIMVNPTDTCGLTQAMEKVLAPVVSQELSSKGLKRAAEFKWEYTAIQTIRVYEETLSHK